MQDTFVKAESNLEHQQQNIEAFIQQLESQSIKTLLDKVTGIIKEGYEAAGQENKLVVLLGELGKQEETFGPIDPKIPQEQQVEPLLARLICRYAKREIVKLFPEQKRANFIGIVEDTIKQIMPIGLENLYDTLAKYDSVPLAERFAPALQDRIEEIANSIVKIGEGQPVKEQGEGAPDANQAEANRAEDKVEVRQTNPDLVYRATDAAFRAQAKFTKYDYVLGQLAKDPEYDNNKQLKDQLEAQLHVINEFDIALASPEIQNLLVVAEAKINKARELNNAENNKARPEVLAPIQTEIDQKTQAKVEAVTQLINKIAAAEREINPEPEAALATPQQKLARLIKLGAEEVIIGHAPGTATQPGQLKQARKATEQLIEENFANLGWDLLKEQSPHIFHGDLFNQPSGTLAERLKEALENQWRRTESRLESVSRALKDSRKNYLQAHGVADLADDTVKKQVENQDLSNYLVGLSPKEQEDLQARLNDFDSQLREDLEAAKGSLAKYPLEKFVAKYREEEKERFRASNPPQHQASGQARQEAEGKPDQKVEEGQKLNKYRDLVYFNTNLAFAAQVQETANKHRDKHFASLGQERDNLEKHNALINQYAVALASPEIQKLAALASEQAKNKDSLLEEMARLKGEIGQGSAQENLEQVKAKKVLAELIFLNANLVSLESNPQISAVPKLQSRNQHMISNLIKDNLGLDKFGTKLLKILQKPSTSLQSQLNEALQEEKLIVRKNFYLGELAEADQQNLRARLENLDGVLQVVLEAAALQGKEVDLQQFLEKYRTNEKAYLAAIQPEEKAEELLKGEEALGADQEGTSIKKKYKKVINRAIEETIDSVAPVEIGQMLEKIFNGHNSGKQLQNSEQEKLIDAATAKTISRLVDKGLHLSPIEEMQEKIKGTYKKIAELIDGKVKDHQAGRSFDSFLEHLVAEKTIDKRLQNSFSTIGKIRQLLEDLVTFIKDKLFNREQVQEIANEVANPAQQAEHGRVADILKAGKKDLMDSALKHSEAGHSR